MVELGGGGVAAATQPVNTQPADRTVPGETRENPGARGKTGLGKLLGGLPGNPFTARRSGDRTVAQKPVQHLKGAKPLGVSVSTRLTKAARRSARAGLPERIHVTIPPAGKPVTLKGSLLAAEALGLPKGKRARFAADYGKTVQERVNKGFDLFTAIQAGKAPVPAKSGDIRDFMLFLKARASQETGDFAGGAYNIPDPGGKIHAWLDSSTDVYQRSSTHIQGFSKHEGCGHRGIDLKMHQGMGTLLYGAMKDGVMGTKGDRLFLKMESHGCRFSTLKKSGQDIRGPQSRPKHYLPDLKNSVTHGMGGAKTLLGLQKTEGTRKERLDKGVEKEFKALVKQAEAQGFHKTAQALDRNSPAGKRTGFGIRTMKENIRTVLDAQEKLNPAPSKDPDGWNKMAAATMDLERIPDNLRGILEKFMERLEGKYDHLEHRIGDEVVMDMEALEGSDSIANRENQAAGKARAVVRALVAMAGRETVKTEDLESVLGDMYDLGRSIDAKGTDTQEQEHPQLLSKAFKGLTGPEKERLRSFLDSPVAVDLRSELAKLSDDRTGILFYSE